jgi:hypothetical protein
MNELLYGLITGIIFGFLLKKGRVIRYEKQLGALRLFDHYNDRVGCFSGHNHRGMVPTNFFHCLG